MNGYTGQVWYHTKRGAFIIEKESGKRKAVHTQLMRSMTFKLVAGFTLVALVGVLIVAVLANRLTSNAFGSYVAQGVQTQDQRIAAYVLSSYETGGWRSVAAALIPLSHSTGTRLLVADPSGKVIADSAGQLTGDSLPSPAPSRQVKLTASGKTLGTLYVIDDPLVNSMMGGSMGNMMGNSGGMMSGSGVRSGNGTQGLASPSSPPASNSAAAVSSGNADSAQGYLEAVGQATWIAGALAVLAAVSLGLLLSRGITSPLRRLTFAAGRVASGDFSQRVEVGSRDELASLADAFNTMAASLAKTEEQRRRLFSDIAHELKTPISVIQGNVEAIMDGVVDPTPERMASLRDETLLLSRLVTDLRDLSLAEAGQLKLHPEPANLEDLLKGAVAGMQPEADRRGVRLETQLEEGLPRVLVDPDRVGQVLRNLIANALRYTPTGDKVEISAGGRQLSAISRQSSLGSQHPELRTQNPALRTGTPSIVVVTVRDTGSGIPAEDLPHIFERFYRVDRSRNRASGGTGLGLAVVKQLVESQGGTVWAESEIGKGSAFNFTLPVVNQ